MPALSFEHASKRTHFESGRQYRFAPLRVRLFAGFARTPARTNPRALPRPATAKPVLSPARMSFPDMKNPRRLRPAGVFSCAPGRAVSVHHGGDEAPQVLPGERSRFHVTPETDGRKREAVGYGLDAITCVRFMVVHVFLVRGSLPHLSSFENPKSLEIVFL